MKTVVFVLMMVCFAIPANAGTVPPIKGTYGSIQGCQDWRAGTEGDYVVFDRMGWGYGGELICTSSAIHKVGDLEYDMTATCQQVDDGSSKQHSTLIIVNDKEIVLDGIKSVLCSK